MRSSLLPTMGTQKRHNNDKGLSGLCFHDDMSRFCSRRCSSLSVQQSYHLLVPSIQPEYCAPDIPWPSQKPKPSRQRPACRPPGSTRTGHRTTKAPRSRRQMPTRRQSNSCLPGDRWAVFGLSDELITGIVLAVVMAQPPCPQAEAKAQGATCCRGPWAGHEAAEEAGES
jgi:hypothetical protein